MPSILIGILGICVIALSFIFEPIRSDTFWTVPLGIICKGYSASDYFPIVPNLGWFMLGVVLGRTLYKNKTTFFPKANVESLPIKALSFCGRHSLWIYLGHQPIVYSIVFGLYTIMK